MQQFAAVLFDDECLRGLIAHALHYVGFEVVSDDKYDSFWLRMQESAPRVFLVDADAGRASGFLEQRGADPVLSSIPVIVLARQGHGAHSLSLGATSVVEKPVDFNVLLRALSAYAPFEIV